MRERERERESEKIQIQKKRTSLQESVPNFLRNFFGNCERKTYRTKHEIWSINNKKSKEERENKD